MHITKRTCISCRKICEKQELIKIIKNKKNEFFVSHGEFIEGRGAYVCKNLECIENLIKKRALNRVFKQEVSKQIYEKLNEELKEIK